MILTDTDKQLYEINFISLQCCYIICIMQAGRQKFNFSKLIYFLTSINDFQAIEVCIYIYNIVVIKVKDVS